MQSASRRAFKGLSNGSRLALRLVWLAMFGLTAGAQGQAVSEKAQPTPPAEQKGEEKAKAPDQTKADDQNKTTEQNPMKAAIEARERAAAAKPGARPKSQGRRAASSFEMNPNAKYVVEKDTMSLPAVWRGEDTLTFPFTIRNAGTEPLRIKAKGG